MQLGQKYRLGRKNCFSLQNSTLKGFFSLFFFDRQPKTFVNFLLDEIDRIRQPFPKIVSISDIFILIMSFQSQAKQQFMTFLGQTSHAIPTSEDQYISQFLVFESEEKPVRNVTLEELDEPSEGDKQPEQPEEIYEQGSVFEESSLGSPKAKRSPLHNFQKHFVTTIRRSVRLRWPEQLPGYLELAKDIWEIFKNSRKYTKQFVSLILGQNDPHVDPELLNKYGLLQCVSRHPESDYHKAQAYLKAKVLETFKAIPKEKIMYERRIGKKEEFANYFFKVLAEIEEGVMNKRLPKKKRGGRRNSETKYKKFNHDVLDIEK